MNRPAYPAVLLRLCLVLAVASLVVPTAGRSQGLRLESPRERSAEVGKPVEFELGVLGLQQLTLASERSDALRFGIEAGADSSLAQALDPATGRFRWVVPCAAAGRTLSLPFKLYNAGTLIATSTTVLRVSRDIPPITANYSDQVVVNPDAPIAVDVSVASPCGTNARLEPLPNARGVVPTVSGAYPSFKVNFKVPAALRGETVELAFKLSDATTSRTLLIKALVDNTPREPYFEVGLPKKFEVLEDETRQIRVRAYDPNPNDRVRYTITNISALRGQAQITDAEAGILTWTSKAEAIDRDRDRAEFPIVVEASDGRLSVTETFTLVVLRKVSLSQRQQRLQRYTSEYQRLQKLQKDAISFYTTVNRKADRRSNGELYRIVAKSLFTIGAAVSATIVHEQTRVIAVSSATVLVAGVDLVSNRRRKYDPFEDLKAVRELIKQITVSISDQRYKYDDDVLGDLGRISYTEDIVTVTRELAKECDKYEVELKLLQDRYQETLDLLGRKRGRQ